MLIQPTTGVPSALGAAGAAERSWGAAGTTSWTEKMGIWVEQWLHALANMHRETAPYDLRTYENYIKWYSTRKRVHCIRVVDDPQLYEATMTDTYPTQPDSAFHRVNDLQWEMHELATSVLSTVRTRGRTTPSRQMRCSNQVVDPYRTRSWGRRREKTPRTMTLFRSWRYGEWAVGGGPSHSESSQVSVGASQLHSAPGVSQPTQHPLGAPPLRTPPQATHVDRVPRPPEPLMYSHQRLQPPWARPGATRGVRP